MDNNYILFYLMKDKNSKFLINDKFWKSSEYPWSNF